jgi:hypothetical protein
MSLHVNAAAVSPSPKATPVADLASILVGSYQTIEVITPATNASPLKNVCIPKA